MELSRDRKSCHRSRHVDRRYFKVRELCFQGELRVEHIKTEDNAADLLTKPLGAVAFAKHRTPLSTTTSPQRCTTGVASEGGVSAYV